MNAEFPRAILHFDGDAFFASVEQSMNYKLRGKPVITGAERGAATSISYEAKRLGVHRGMRLSEIRIRCPEAVVVPSNYVAYAMYAHRMYSIVRSYTPLVEEYSIDECFADITGLDAVFGISYEEIALKIKAELEESLGLTFGAGLAATKTLAKIASKAHKPAGFTSIPMSAISKFLEDMSIYNVWGLGGASGTTLTKLGAETALKFAQRSDSWLTEHRLGKAYRDIWLELNGHFIKTLTLESTGTVGSIMTTRTFKPPSASRSYIFAQLSKNVERVCEKVRHAGVQAKGISFFLKTQEFTYHGVSLELSVPIANPSEVLSLIEKQFDEVYAEGILYRASGITLRNLVSNKARMPDLFGETRVLEHKEKSFEAIDVLNKKYGKQTLFLGSSLQAMKDVVITRTKKTLNVPFLGVVH